MHVTHTKIRFLYLITVHGETVGEGKPAKGAARQRQRVGQNKTGITGLHMAQNRIGGNLTP